MILYAHVIKLRILRWRDYPGLSGWAVNAIMYPKREVVGDFMSHTEEEGEYDTEAEITVM